jgi:hypothetical protein
MTRYWQPLTLRPGVVLSLLLALFMAGCRTPSPFAPVDLNQSGWKQREYQVLWLSKPGANEMVCDVLEARHASGKTFLQVSKTPLVLVTIQCEGDKWWVEYGPRPRSAKGAMPPDAAHLWVLVALQKQTATDLKVESLSNQTARWINLKTGERIEGVPRP